MSKSDKVALKVQLRSKLRSHSCEKHSNSLTILVQEISTACKHNCLDKTACGHDCCKAPKKQMTVEVQCVPTEDDEEDSGAMLIGAKGIVLFDNKPWTGAITQYHAKNDTYTMFFTKDNSTITDRSPGASLYHFAVVHHNTVSKMFCRQCR